MRLQETGKNPCSASWPIASMSILTKDVHMLDIIEKVSEQCKSDCKTILDPAPWERVAPADVCVPWSNDGVLNDDLAERLNLDVATRSPVIVVLPFSCQARQLERRLKAIFVGNPLQFSEYPELMSMLSSNSLMGSRRWRNWLARCDVRSVVEDGNSMLAEATGHDHHHRVPFSFIGRFSCPDSESPTSKPWMYLKRDHPSPLQKIHPTLLRKSHVFANNLLWMHPTKLQHSLIDYIRFLETWFTGDEAVSQTVENGLKAALAALGSLRLEGTTARTRLRSLGVLSSIRQLSGEAASGSSPDIVDVRLQWAGLFSLNEHFFGKECWLAFDWSEFDGDDAAVTHVQSLVRGKHPELGDVPADLLPCRLIRLLHHKFIEVSRSIANRERLSKLKALSDWWLHQRKSGLIFVLAFLLSLVSTDQTSAVARIVLPVGHITGDEERILRLLISIKKVCRIVGSDMLPHWLHNLLDSHESPRPGHLFVNYELHQCLWRFKCFLQTVEPGPLKDTFSDVLSCVFRFAWLGNYHYTELIALMWTNPELRRHVDRISADLSVLVTPMMGWTIKPYDVGREFSIPSWPNLSVTCLCDLPILVAPFVGEMQALKLLLASSALPNVPCTEVIDLFGSVTDVFRDCNAIIDMHKVVDTYQVRELVRGMEGCARLENVPLGLSKSTKRLKTINATRENMASILAAKTQQYVSECLDTMKQLKQRANAFQHGKIPFRNAARCQTPPKVAVSAPVSASPRRGQSKTPPSEEVKLDTPSDITCPRWCEPQPTHKLGVVYPAGLRLHQLRSFDANTMASSKFYFGEVLCEWVTVM
ncbi:MAG: hypothetical protein KVP17_003527 [Porospora cf. gigantea B]|uniref:uncharacterized protein n=1 Tax=Porospora cf. gigantea B TaxID=2853592 RepID=UPI003571EBA1|nr:MAG: hypothetical protein KVP17_003527 [Porospora cf. gigantea B]